MTTGYPAILMLDGRLGVVIGGGVVGERKVKTLLDTYPPGSQVGQVLRSLGLPSSRAPEGSGRELWTYEKAGVAYLVEGPKVIETRTLPGGARSAAVPPGKDEPEPAVRVDTP